MASMGSAANNLMSIGTGKVWIVSKHTGIARLFQFDPGYNNGSTYFAIEPGSPEANAIIGHINHFLVLNQGF